MYYIAFFMMISLLYQYRSLVECTVILLASNYAARSYFLSMILFDLLDKHTINLDYAIKCGVLILYNSNSLNAVLVTITIINSTRNISVKIFLNAIFIIALVFADLHTMHSNTAGIAAIMGLPISCILTSDIYKSKKARVEL